MAKKTGQLPCQYPNAARKAGIVLFAPAYPIEVVIDPSLPEHKYGSTGPYRITSRSLHIPENIFMDLQTRVSSSLMQEFGMINKDTFLSQHCPHLQEDLVAMGDAIKMLVDAGMKNTYVPPDVMRLLREREISIADKSKQLVSGLQGKPGFGQSVQMTPEKLDHLLGKCRFVANAMLEESKGQQKG